MTETVKITIDGQDYHVPKGMNLVDAAKLHGIEIPTFCYHPKMEPAGMCRMCLVELGSVQKDRETGQPQLDENGEPVVRWFPTLQTACTQTVHDGMVVRTQTEKVQAGRSSVVEFLLTSHPLDCPTCDKGGECGLQELTMEYGPGESKFRYEDKHHAEKHVPLGDLIILDRERCILCARCVRYCDELVGEPVLGFHNRGRDLVIETVSDPPFDTIFSGNTTDICPVGALTTADFRFGARPWEMEPVPTVCTYCAVGCNMTADTRISADFGGKRAIKRIMPRQNEAVNEIWICDKGRFGHHHSRAEDRLRQPLLRRDGELVPVSWDEALSAVAEKLAQHGSKAFFVAGHGLANEDLWELRKLARQTSRRSGLGLCPATVSGADAVRQAGVGVGTRLQDLGAGDAVLVVASDLYEEAPLWWLQVKQAADRGATVVVANARPTKLDRYAARTVRYRYGEAVRVLHNFAAIARRSEKLDAELLSARVEGWDALEDDLKGSRVPDEQEAAAEAILDAENLVVLAGNDGMGFEQHAELMQAAANLLIITGHVGRANNGLVAVWPGANTQGALDMGFSSEAVAAAWEKPPAMWVIAEADLLGEDARMAQVLEQADFVVVAAQFLTATARQADVVLPVQSVAEREGTLTNGMRRVQRFYMAQSPLEGTLPAWKAFAHLTQRAKDGPKPFISPAQVMQEITEKLAPYAEMSYANLARVEEQYPPIRRDDLYYGGTAYENTGGLGVQWRTDAEAPRKRLEVRSVQRQARRWDGVLAVPVRVLYDRALPFAASALMSGHVPAPYAELNAEDAAALGVAEGDRIALEAAGARVELTARVDGRAPQGVVLVPQHLGDVLVAAPETCVVQKIEE